MSTIEIEQEQEITPKNIIRIGMGFWPAKVLLTADKLGLFTELSDGPLFASEIQRRLGLHEKSAAYFLDSLVALGLIERQGKGFTAIYSNTPETATFLNRRKPTYLGGFLEKANDRLYPFWNNLEEALQTGREIKAIGKPLFSGAQASA